MTNGRPTRHAVAWDAVVLRGDPVEEARGGSGPSNGKGFPAQGLTDTRGAVSHLARGEGKVLDIAGEKVAVHRDDEGEVHAVFPVSTRLGCLLDFDGREPTWDCAWHGPRFGVDGEVFNGPATRALKPRSSMPRPPAPAWARAEAA